VQISRLDEQTLALTGIDIFCCELLRQIPLSAETGEGDAAYSRLYPSPTGGRDRSFEEEWKDYVTPDLRLLFQSSIEVIRQDLASFPSDEPSMEYSLYIPVKHLKAWINGLNQARLALAARYDVTEEDMEEVSPENNARSLALFQIHFYGILQEYFLRETDEI